MLRYSETEMFWKQTMRESFIVNILLHMQAQAALHRKWVQWKSSCGKSKWVETPTTSNHFSSASITETSCPSLGPATAASALSVQNMQPSTKRQEKSKICSNGDVDMVNRRETPDVWMALQYPTEPNTFIRGSLNNEHLQMWDIAVELLD